MSLEEVKSRQQKTWSSGDYGKIAWITVPLADALCEVVADELLRVCRSGGVVGLANWTPAGFIGQMLKLVGRHVPPPTGIRPPTSWGTEEGARELLGTGTGELAFTTASVRQRFPTASGGRGG